MEAVANLLLASQAALSMCRVQGSGGVSSGAALRDALGKPVNDLGQVINEIHAAGGLTALNDATIARVRKAFADFGDGIAAELARLAAADAAGEGKVST
jgi:hypothetical protein